MGVWKHIIIEGFCMFRNASVKNWKTHSYLCNGKFGKKVKIYKNDNYIPKSKRPLWCKKKNHKLVPQWKCLGGNCPFFAYTNALKKEYIKLGK